MKELTRPGLSRTSRNTRPKATSSSAIFPSPRGRAGSGAFAASINIYMELGLVTLMGLISKHGILMVDVANAQQLAGKSKREAIVAAADIRLRPILMTTAAMVLGVVPLLLASGAGAASRFNMGLVIATGLSIGTLFTLFVLPAVYVVIAGRHAPAPARPAVRAKPADGVRA